MKLLFTETFVFRLKLKKSELKASAHTLPNHSYFEKKTHVN